MFRDHRGRTCDGRQGLQTSAATEVILSAFLLFVFHSGGMMPFALG